MGAGDNMRGRDQKAGPNRLTRTVFIKQNADKGGIERGERHDRLLHLVVRFSILKEDVEQ